MAAPKAQTIQQRFGFCDNDLKTPRHDELMIWLDNNMESVLKSLGILFGDEDRARYDKAISNAIEEHNELGTQEPPLYFPRKFSNTWEYPITQLGSKFIVGFIDMMTNVFCTRPYGRKSNYSDTKYIWSNDELSEKVVTFLFEVKTTIPSLGELIRQVRMYQQYCDHSKFVVVSPDDRFRLQIENQGIAFVKYEED